MSENFTAQSSKLELVWRWAPAILFLVAFLVRLVGIGWGLPNELHNQSYHPDEQPIWVFSQGVKPAEFDFTPGVYNYGTLYLTTLRIASDMVSVYSGKPDPGDPWDYIGKCHLTGRVINALAGAGLAVLVFLMGLRITSRFGAVFGGLAVALSPGLVVHSRFQTTDMLATFLFAASLFFSLRILFEPEQRLKLAIWAGVFAGLSAGAKYTGILALLALPVALYVSEGPKWKPLGFGFAASLIAFFVATPGVVLDFAKFQRDFVYEAIHTSTGHGLVFEGVGSGFLVHLANLGVVMGTIGLLLSFGGLVWAMVAKKPWVLVLLPTFISYYFLIGRADVLFLRYTFPLVVILALALGWLVGEAHERKGKLTILAAAGILALGALAMQTTLWTGMMTRQDPRDVTATLAKTWGDAKVGLVSDPWFYTPPFIKDSAILRGAIDFQAAEMSESKDPTIFTYGMNSPGHYDWDARLFERKPDYVVYSNFESGDLERLTKFKTLRPDTSVLVERFKAFHEQLRKEYDAYASVPAQPGNQWIPHDMQYVAPVIYIWKRKSP